MPPAARKVPQLAQARDFIFAEVLLAIVVKICLATSRISEHFLQTTALH